jgi:glycosyltransferase involved in cell wall biosynthesis
VIASLKPSLTPPDSHMAKVSFVIPVYQNSGSIEETWSSIAMLFDGPLKEHSYEIVLVDDGSTDDSWAEMCRVARADPYTSVVRFTRNFGQLAAIVAGYERMTGDVMINMSADLQDPVELVVEMVHHWSAGSDVVVGFREERQDPLIARVLSRIAYGALRLSNRDIPPGGFDYVLMSRRAIESFLSYRGRNRFFQGDVLWAGRKTTYLPYARRKRPIGRSQYTIAKKLKLFIDFIIDGSYLPIRLMSLCGVACAALGALYALVIVGAWARHRTPFPGWAPIMIIVLFVGGVIMLMLGVIGEYLWRILDEIKAKPLYIIDEPREEL